PEFKPSFKLARTLEDLRALHCPEVNLCIWRRPPVRGLLACVEEEIATRRIKRVLNTDPRRPEFDELLQDLPATHPARASFKLDLHTQVALFARLFPCHEIQLKLETCTGSMCERFHIDRVPLRSICTYVGPGTEWLDDRTVDRSKLGPGSGGLPDEESGLLLPGAHIECIERFDVGLMKGRTWPGQEGGGLVHRSPRTEAGAPPRVLFKIDAV
ncbi:MAG: DUF1826 domain-containing protein, partial [Gemmataceae bacterium]